MADDQVKDKTENEEDEDKSTAEAISKLLKNKGGKQDPAVREIENAAKIARAKRVIAEEEKKLKDLHKEKSDIEKETGKYEGKLKNVEVKTKFHEAEHKYHEIHGSALKANWDYIVVGFVILVAVVVAFLSYGDGDSFESMAIDLNNGFYMLVGWAAGLGIVLWVIVELGKSLRPKKGGGKASAKPSSEHH